MKNFKIIFLTLSFIGVIFSGYMSGVKLFSKICAFGESCPYFLGISACYFGFVMFFVLLILSILLKLNQWNIKLLSKSIFITSLIGVCFAGYFSSEEIPALINNGFKAYLFGLPTCIIGFIFFIFIFIISIFFIKKIKINNL